MANIITKLQSLFVHTETAEGTADGGFPAGADAILASNLNARQIPRDFNARDFAQAMGTRNGKIGGIMGAPISFDTEIKGDGSTTVCEVSSLLKSVFGSLTTVSLSGLTATGGTSTVITTASTTGITDNTFILVETGSGTNLYEAAFVVSHVANTSITVSPALSFSPVSGAKIQGTTTYSTLSTGHPSLSIYNYLSQDSGSTNMVAKYLGCHGNMKFSAKKAGGIPMASWSWTAWNWAIATGQAAVTPTYDTALPPTNLSTLFKVAGTTTDLLDLEIDLGNTVSLKTSQNSSGGVIGTPITNRHTTGKFRIYADSTSQSPITGWTGNTQITLSAQYGNTQFGTVAWYCPQAERTNVPFGDEAGVTTHDVSFNANISSGNDAFYMAVG